MTRRILLVLLTFTAAVLVGAVVPLTLDAASHDRTSFIQATAGMARTDAAIAQSRLDALASSPPSSSADEGEGKADPALVVLIDQTKQTRRRPADPQWPPAARQPAGRQGHAVR